MDQARFFHIVCRVERRCPGNPIPDFALIVRRANRADFHKAQFRVQRDQARIKVQAFEINLRRVGRVRAKARSSAMPRRNSASVS